MTEEDFVTGSFRLQNLNSTTYFTGMGAVQDTDIQSGVSIILSNGDPVIIGFFSTEDLKTTAALKLFSYVTAEAERVTGIKPLASASTSLRATRFANTAIKLGIVGGVVDQAFGEPASQSNDIDWERAKYFIQEDARTIKEWLITKKGSEVAYIDEKQIEQDWLELKNKIANLMQTSSFEGVV